MVAVVSATAATATAFDAAIASLRLCVAAAREQDRPLRLRYVDGDTVTAVLALASWHSRQEVDGDGWLVTARIDGVCVTALWRPGMRSVH